MTDPTQSTDRIMRVKEVMTRSGLKRTALYSKVRDNQFPKPLKLGARAVGWRESDVLAWIDSLIPAEGTHAE